MMYRYFSNLLSQLVAHREIVIIMMMLGFIFGFVYRRLLTKIFPGTTRGSTVNIGNNDRIMRIVGCIALFGWAITTSFSPILLFFSGFCLFESIFSWCGLYAALGKSSCPIR